MLSASHLKIRQPRIIGVSPRDPHTGDRRPETAKPKGASPLPASSGRTVRYRLNRGGDRALNRALHTIAVTRMRSCPTTQAYVARRTEKARTRGRSAWPQAVHCPPALPHPDHRHDPRNRGQLPTTTAEMLPGTS